MKIYCRNTSCKYAVQIEPFKFSSQNDWEESYVAKCSRDKVCIALREFFGRTSRMTILECTRQYGSLYNYCRVGDCLWNEGFNCFRKYIEITDIRNPEGKIVYGCKNYSLKGFTGRINLMNYIPKGDSHIDDSYSEVLDSDNKVSRSYPTHLRQKKESKPKKLGG